MDMSDGPVVDRLGRAFAVGHVHTVHELAAEDHTETYPRSGELIQDRASAIAIDAAYPGGLPTVVGEPRFSETASGVVVESIWDDGGGGGIHHVVGVCDVREGRLRAARRCFASPFEPAGSRCRSIRRIA